MKDIRFRVSHNAPLNEKVWIMTLSASETLPVIQGGQFLHLTVPGKLLRRPFGIFDYGQDYVKLVYAVVGEGTKILTTVAVGTELDCLLPLGNGFVLGENHRKIALLGGGLGVVPLYSVTKSYPDRIIDAYLGFGCGDNVILREEFESACRKTIIATDDGSCGYKGYAADAMLEGADFSGYDIVLACGPRAMLKNIATKIKDMPVLVSMEERMGCGIGACLVCTCGVRSGDGRKNLRVCADGPVFPIEEVII